MATSRRILGAATGEIDIAPKVPEIKVVEPVEDLARVAGPDEIQIEIIKNWYDNGTVEHRLGAVKIVAETLGRTLIRRGIAKAK